MKKLLALVMALVMVMGLATVGTSAAYADAKDINYKEAVDVMTAIGVLGGDESGFRPADTLKRSEGAKIVAYLMLGNKTAEALSGTGTKFTDVPANHWAAGYIEYLAAEGVLGGKGNGIFDPDGDLTTTQFAKMLLVALGYDAAIEGYGGPDWAINVQKQATKLNLFSGNSDVVGSAAVNREEAALYALNTLKTPIVEYETKGTKIEVNGASITTGASNATYRLNTGKSIARYKQIDNKTTNINATASDIIEFAEEYYSKLVLDKGDDAFRRPANTWYYDGKKVGEYASGEDLLYTAPVTVGQIYKDLGLTSTTYVTKNGKNAATDTATKDNYNYFIDGVANDAVLALTKEGTAKVGGYGTDTYVYYDEEGIVRISEVNWYAGEVTGKFAATATKDAYITIAGNINGTSGNKTTTSFEVGDIVLYTASEQNSSATDLTTKGTFSIKTVEKAETLEGEMTNFVTVANNDGVHGQIVTGSITIDGTKYNYSTKVDNTPDGNLLRKGVKLEITLDKYGNVINVGEYSVKNYAVVVKTGVGGTYGKDSVVNLLLTDGTTTGAVTLNSDNHSNNAGTVYYRPSNSGGAVTVGDIVSYTINSSGNYTLTQLSDVKTYTNPVKSEEIITNGSGTLADEFYDNADSNSQKANGKTIFLVKDSSGNYNAYEGIKNVPTIISGTNGVSYAVNSYAGTNKSGVKNAASQLVYIDLSGNGAGFLKSSQTIFVAVDLKVGETTDANGDNYYEFSAFINGEPTKLKVNSEQAEALQAEFDGTGGYAMYDSISYNGKEIATLGNRLESYVGSSAEKKGTVGLGGSAYPYASDVKVFYINSDNEISADSVKNIPDSDTTMLWANFNSSDELNYIFWMKDVSKLIVDSNTANVLTAVTNYPAVKVVDDVDDPTDGAAALTINSAFEIPAGHKLIVDGKVTVTNNATVNVYGTLEADQVIVDNGTVNVGKAGSATAAKVSSNKNIVIAANGHVTTYSGTTLTSADSGSTSVINGASLQVRGGTVSFAGPVVVVGKLLVNGGNLNIGGKLTAAASYANTGLSSELQTLAGTAGTLAVNFTSGRVSLGELAVDNNGDNPTTSVTFDGATVNTGNVTLAASAQLTISAGTVAMDVVEGESTSVISNTAGSDSVTATTIDSEISGAEDVTASGNVVVTFNTVSFTSKYYSIDGQDNAKTLASVISVKSAKFGDTVIGTDKVKVEVKKLASSGSEQNSTAYAKNDDVVTLEITIDATGINDVTFLDGNYYSAAPEDFKASDEGGTTSEKGKKVSFNVEYTVSGIPNDGL